MLTVVAAFAIGWLFVLAVILGVCASAAAGDRALAETSRAGEPAPRIRTRGRGARTWAAPPAPAHRHSALR